MPETPIRYSVVVPVYNSTASLEELVNRVEAVLGKYGMGSYEVIFVDDGSPNPETWPTLKRIIQAYSEVKAVQLTRNFGKAGALLCGLEMARGERIFTMDDDLQHRPEDMAAFIAEEHHDVVLGQFAKKEHSWSQRMTSKLKHWLDHKLIKIPEHVQDSPYKLMKREVVEAMRQIKTGYPYLPSLLFYVTQDAVMVPATHDRRLHNESAFGFGKRIKLFSNLLINNSALLLRATALIGLLMAGLSLVAVAYVILRKLITDREIQMGWTSLMSVLLFTSGLMLFSLGVVGEYLIRIINGVESKPPFIVRKSDERLNSK
jgi:glycosyltransferase involved in cell wall biosynthesis